MGKHRVTKKRITKRKVVKKPNKPDKSDKPINPLEAAVAGKMSRLEYEHAMMDPRFKAAMMGFNAPRPNTGINSLLHDHENKNNELTKQLTMETELANAKIKNQKLKTELQQSKAEFQRELSELRAKNDNDLKTAEINNLKQKHEYDKQIYQLNTSVAYNKRSLEEQQTRHKQEQELLQANYDKAISELRKQHVEDMIPIQDAIDTAKSELYMAKEVHDQNIEMMKAQNENVITQIKAATQPTIQLLNAKTQMLDDQLKVIGSKLDAVQQLKHAKLKLDQAQIQSISQPIIQQLNMKADDLQRDLTLNKDIYNEIKKQNDTTTLILQLQQKVDPEIRAEYEQRLRDEKVKSHQLELTKAFAESAYKAQQDNEATTREIITLGARLYGDKFDVNSIHNPQFNKDLLKLEADLRVKHADSIKRLEQAKRVSKYQEKADDVKQQLFDEQARIQAVKDSPELTQLMNQFSKEKIEQQRVTEKTKEIADFVEKENANREGIIQSTIDNMHVIYSKYPWAKQIADEISIQNGGRAGVYDPNHFPLVIEQVKAKLERNKKLYESIPYGELNKDNGGLELSEFDKFLRENNIDVAQARYNMNKQIDNLRAENAALYKQRDDNQKRAIQSATLARDLLGHYIETDPENAEQILQQNGFGSSTEYGDNPALQNLFSMIPQPITISDVQSEED